jgi:hypothetical protein
LLFRDVLVELAVVLPVLGLVIVVVVVVVVVAAVEIGVLVARNRRGRELTRFRDRTGAVAPVAIALRLGEQRRERSGERVDLVGGKHGAVREVGFVLGEQTLQPQQQREVLAPLDRRILAPGLDLLERVVEGQPAGRVGRQHDGRVFVWTEKGLSGPVLGAGGGLAETVCRLRR